MTARLTRMLGEDGHGVLCPYDESEVKEFLFSEFCSGE
jgi:hypothetical protein